MVYKLIMNRLSAYQVFKAISMLFNPNPNNFVSIFINFHEYKINMHAAVQVTATVYILSHGGF